MQALKGLEGPRGRAYKAPGDLIMFLRPYKSLIRPFKGLIRRVLKGIIRFLRAL